MISEEELQSLQAELIALRREVKILSKRYKEMDYYLGHMLEQEKRKQQMYEMERAWQIQRKAESQKAMQDMNEFYDNLRVYDTKTQIENDSWYKSALKKLKGK